MTPLSRECVSTYYYFIETMYVMCNKLHIIIMSNLCLKVLVLLAITVQFGLVTENTFI